MKSNKLLIGIFILLVIVSVFLIFKEKDSSIKSKEMNFAVQNTDEIDQIEITFDSFRISIKKNKDNWRVNETFQSNKEAITLLFSTLQRLDIVSPVPHEYQAVKRKLLETRSTNVMIWLNGSLFRSFYLIYDTAGTNSTIIMMHNSDIPFIANIKGYELKDLTKIFTIDSKFWRGNTLFDLEKDEIAEIDVTYTENKDISFRIINQANRMPSLWSQSHEVNPDLTDQKAINDYLYYFTNINYRYINHIINEEYLQKLKFANLEISTTAGNKIILTLFRKPLAINQETNKYDLNICYGKINDENEIVEIYYIDIDPILKGLSDFIKK